MAGEDGKMIGVFSKYYRHSQRTDKINGMVTGQFEEN
jgi:hypothetical protein